MVRPERFELPTYWFEASCSIQLSYGRTWEIPGQILLRRRCGDWLRFRRRWDRVQRNALNDIKSGAA